jgi:hypothetical protein
MQIRRFLFLAAGLLFLACGTASAQGAGKTGVTMGFPRTYDKLKTYFSPRFTYGRSTSDSTTSSITTSTSETTATTTGGSGSFGAQYELSDKFSVFGELGFGYSRTKVTSSTSNSKNTGNTWSSRSGVGVIFYF